MPISKYRVSVYLHFLFILFTISAFSQNRKEPFNITPTGQKVAGSLYNKIVLVDVRPDTVNMGFVQLGLLNAHADIVFKKPLQEQLSNLIGELSDSSSRTDTLFFQLRKFFFSEQTKSFSETGTFIFRATLYRWQNDHYLKINEVDTVMLIQAADVTKSLEQHAVREIVDFIQQNLLNKGVDPFTYSKTELSNPDSLEKAGILLYTTNKYTDGLYLTYKSFSEQLPDKAILVEEKNNKIKTVKIEDSSGKMIRIRSRDSYAIVYQGKPYAATSYDFYPLTKEKQDFYFTGKVKAGTDPMAAYVFGLMGSLLSSTNYSTYEMKIDHLTGRFIRIRYIPDPEDH